MIPPRAHRLALLALFSLAAVATAAPLPGRLQQVLTAEGIPPTALSVVIRDTTSGHTVLDWNPAVPRAPASTLKVLTTWAALEALGPNHHFVTRAYALGPVEDGRLKGDLVLVGGGDPAMTVERWWRFVASLRATGLERIDGDILLDRSLYAEKDGDPAAFDGKGDQSYNVLPDPLLVNLQSAEFHAVVEHGTARVLMDPAPANLHIDNGVRATSEGCPGAHLKVTEVGGDPLHLALDGVVGPRCSAHVRRPIMRPADYAFGTFVSYWRELGGSFDGSQREALLPGDARLLVEYPSESLADIVRLTNKYSNNTMARSLLLEFGHVLGAGPVSAASGERALLDWLAQRGLVFPELVVDNGSGLSHAARISADSLARILEAAYHSRYYPEFLTSLPLGGQDGTLKRRFVDVGSEARVRMKTGHIAGVSALAGWVTTRSGKTLSVVAFVNHPGAESERGDAIVDTVVRWALDRD